MMTAKVHRFVQDVPDWSNLKVIHRGTLPPRSSFFPYTDPSDALDYNPEKSHSVCLSGTWKFDYSLSPYKAPIGFEQPAFDSTRWHDVKVPGMWQMQGFGRPHYTNEPYPFPVNPPHGSSYSSNRLIDTEIVAVPFDNNETGSYLRRFTVPSSMLGQQIRLRFEGVDSAFHLWVNGNLIGYSQGSRNPSEFDITDHVLAEQDNVLAVRVYQFCDGSYIEDQDQWWLSGIFRDVFLVAFSPAHLRDFHVKTELDENYEDATLSVNIETKGQGLAKLTLFDNDKKKKIATASLTITEAKGSAGKLAVPVKAPRKWTAEDPYLYHLLIEFGDQAVAQRVGFRKTELKNGIFTVNGQRIVFRGVNRHEHHPTKGRAVGYDLMRQDLITMKKYNVNAIRTSHQPNDYRLYDLADELGFWVMNEADLECHGFANIEETALSAEDRAKPYNERKIIIYGDAGKWITDNADWEEAYVDRMRQLVTRDKNHPSVIMWSMGNEAFYGRNFQAMYDWARAYDPTRLVHYEGDTDAKTVDVYSMMYPELRIIQDFAKTWKGEKPLLLCEYIHAMGNGPGAIKEYIDEFYKHEMLQGGFVWEWANHGLLTKNSKGEEYYAYGGDFGDEPNDGNFVMDGLLFSDHTPAPGLLEYKKAIEPVQLVDGDNVSARVINRYDFADLNRLSCVCTLIADGSERVIGEVSIPSILPGETGQLEISGVGRVEDLTTETFLNLAFRTKETTSWAEAGHEVARLQYCIMTPMSSHSPPTPESSVSISHASPSVLEVKGTDSIWRFDCVSGSLTSWKKSDKELLQDAPVLDFFRPLTDNDANNIGEEWKTKFVHLVKPHTTSVEWTQTTEGNSVTITCHQRIAPPVLEWSIDATLTYTFTSSTLQISITGKPSGKNLPTSLPRIGLTLSLTPTFKTAKWFGRGPGESYSDKKLSQLYGTYNLPIKDLWTPYEFPQESGNRTDVRWVTFSGDENTQLTAKFLQYGGFNFSACHYRALDIDAAKHPYELEEKRREEVVVRLDWGHNGIGTGSCGPAVLPQYTLKTRPFEFQVLLS